MTACTSPTQFVDPPHTGYLALEREGLEAMLNRTMYERLDPQIASPAYMRWYASQLAATAPHVMSTFLRSAQKVDLRPLLPAVQTPALILEAQRPTEAFVQPTADGERPRDFRDASRYLPHAKRVIFPGVSGVVQHMLPKACARVWLDFAAGLKLPANTSPDQGSPEP